MIVYNYDADLEVSDTCVRSSLLSSVQRLHRSDNGFCHLALVAWYRTDQTSRSAQLSGFRHPVYPKYYILNGPNPRPIALPSPLTRYVTAPVNCKTTDNVLALFKVCKLLHQSVELFLHVMLQFAGFTRTPRRRHTFRFVNKQRAD